jgi:hypothetical protein
MTELYGGGYATAEAPHANADEMGSGEQTVGEAGGRAVETSGETLTRDEYAELSGQEITGEAEAPESLDEADLAAIDAYDQANGETHEPLSRDEYSEQTEQAPARDHDRTPEHIEEPDLSAIDAYGSEPDPAEFPPHETDPDEADDERINTLEAENADAQQEIAGLKAQNDELSARLDRVEGLLADLAKPSDGDSSPAKRGEDRSTTAVDEQDRHDAAGAVHQAEIAERNDSKEGADSKDAEPSRWRRMTSAENVGIAGTVVGAADTLAQFTMHATPEGVVGVSATILGLIATGLAKVEQNKAKKSKERT